MVSGYDPKVGTAAGNRKRLRGQVGADRPVADAVRRRAAQILVENDCADGRHRPETDPVTGDEVCRYCKTVVDDYSDVRPIEDRPNPQED